MRRRYPNIQHGKYGCDLILEKRHHVSPEIKVKIQGHTLRCRREVMSGGLQQSETQLAAERDPEAIHIGWTSRYIM